MEERFCVLQSPLNQKLQKEQHDYHSAADSERLGPSAGSVSGFRFSPQERFSSEPRQHDRSRRKNRRNHNVDRRCYLPCAQIKRVLRLPFPRGGMASGVLKTVPVGKVNAYKQQKAHCHQAGQNVGLSFRRAGQHDNCHRHRDNIQYRNRKVPAEHPSCGQALSGVFFVEVGFADVTPEKIPCTEQHQKHIRCTPVGLPGNRERFEYIAGGLAEEISSEGPNHEKCPHQHDNHARLHRRFLVPEHLSFVLKQVGDCREEGQYEPEPVLSENVAKQPSVKHVFHSASPFSSGLSTEYPLAFISLRNNSSSPRGATSVIRG